MSVESPLELVGDWRVASSPSIAGEVLFKWP
jgi:hypothetical protein